MKDSKTILLLVVSILLLFTSLALLYSWGYQFRLDKNAATPSRAATGNAATARTASSDSLNLALSKDLRKLDAGIDSITRGKDTLALGLDERLAEFYRLRKELGLFFKDGLPSADAARATLQMQTLLTKLDQLRGNNADVQAENTRLKALLKQLNSNAPNPSASTNPPRATLPVNSPVFVASDFKLLAMTNDNTHETGEAQSAANFVGSFLVKNNSNQTFASDMIVVLLQPDGKVLQKSPWESGSFATASGNKIYSCKLRQEYNGGEARRLLFSLPAEKFQKGNYTMQVYHQGVLIGKVSKLLS
ncbi:MAG: hypothetical protein JWQ27_557 [Ferruginibacter sp.]|nr:hypothetical protein [Ferruginibacter sp.]